jgi:uncharacterized protein YbcI
LTDSLAQDLSGGPLVAALSNEFVKLFRNHYGRGPTQTRTIMVEDMIVCRMSDPFTTAEQTMIRIGRMEEVATLRAAVQEQLRDDFSQVIEGLTRRKVVAHVSGVHADPDLCVNVFVLESIANGD